jgi:hypothetical protein
MECWQRAVPTQRRLVAEAVHLAHLKAERRRGMILRHPDLADRLAVALDLSSATAWSGYVPPSQAGDGRLNGSPVRAVLVELLHQAAEREKGVHTMDAPEAAA